MPIPRSPLWLLLAFTALHAGCSPAQAAPPPASPPTTKSAPVSKSPSAIERMLVPGPETEQLARRVGTWDVVMTLRTSPEATPIVISGMIAERTMTGLYLQETMKPAPGSKVPDFRRIDYLTYNKLEARWQYISMDTRAPIGIMAARSYGATNFPEVTVHFDNFAIPGWGQELEGKFMRARHVTTRESDDRDVTRQYWTPVAGAPEWLAVQYEYTRHR
ncbi:DUF1579 domain-containing protein [Pendulispora brunnea]|uniref:DUF1579 domain-containing protein n=1 Tax=Pendulispora brunnea TaxID=2905690 RepID=A0ABZ2KHF1_9BACT